MSAPLPKVAQGVEKVPVSYSGGRLVAPADHGTQSAHRCDQTGGVAFELRLQAHAVVLLEEAAGASTPETRVSRGAVTRSALLAVTAGARKSIQTLHPDPGRVSAGALLPAERASGLRRTSSCERP